MAHGKVVVLTLARAGEARDGAHERRVEEGLGAAGQHLVGVGLVRDVEDQLVGGGVEDAVQGHRELDDAEVGAHVAAHAGAALDDGGANLGAEGGNGAGWEGTYVCRRADVLEIHVPLPVSVRVPTRIPMCKPIASHTCV